MKIEKNKSLKEMTTFKIGGDAQFFCSVQNEKDIHEAIGFSKDKKIPIFILGGGSNILISDGGFPGLVIKMDLKGVDFIENEDGNVEVMAQAGEEWDNLVGLCVEKGLHGIENLSLIPGTVGAAPVQNIGAYGSEVKDTIDEVRVFDIEKEKFVDFRNIDCHFAYRDSVFKKNKGRYIIISVTFILKKEGKVNSDYKDLKEYFSRNKIEKPTVSNIRDAVISIRSSKLPDFKTIGTAGSFFKNPFISHTKAYELKTKYPEIPLFPVDDRSFKVSLAWILDHVCKYKGLSKGAVGTYKNQALVLVNNGCASAQNVKDFAGEIIATVKEKTGIDIEPEVEYVGGN